ncbi:MAG TPA: response regulator [Lysobacter sp.]|nr:response regulator [Lysobacter sp.]
MQSTASSVAGLRLLLVEDEYLLAMYLSQALEDLGAEVIGPAASVDDALDLIEHAPAIDAAILDVNLGGQTSYPVADALASRDVPFVFASGYERRSLPERYQNVGVCPKPFDPPSVMTAIARLRHRH